MPVEIRPCSANGPHLTFDSIKLKTNPGCGGVATLPIFSITIYKKKIGWNTVNNNSKFDKNSSMRHVRNEALTKVLFQSLRESRLCRLLAWPSPLSPILLPTRRIGKMRMSQQLRQMTWLLAQISQPLYKSMWTMHLQGTWNRP